MSSSRGAIEDLPCRGAVAPSIHSGSKSFHCYSVLAWEGIGSEWSTREFRGRYWAEVQIYQVRHQYPLSCLRVQCWLAACVQKYTLESSTLLNAKGKKELIEWCMKEGLSASSYECP
ncbi:hypothetical protein TNCV_2948811 [Trichonephila clavipes]|nr:hypothetical protein TNCV_2948811 [Trichonephila clavipes]